MKRVIILGAGASKSYSESSTGVPMPVAIDFFKTYRSLKIAEDPWVLIGDVINYIMDHRKINLSDFASYEEDIEALHTEIQMRMYDRLKAHPKDFLYNVENIQLLKSYNQLVFLFVSVINEIQNGPVSRAHISLADQLNSKDSILTFNWDTLMDRALYTTKAWNTSSGYFITPAMIFRDGWITPKSDTLQSPLLLKLHGSTNWLTSHNQPENGKLELMQEISPENFFVYESDRGPYPTYEGRYMEGYEDFSYGYYPPNLPINGRPVPEGRMIVKTRIKHNLMPEGVSSDEGLVSMPLIIPPVKSKEYDQFGSLFQRLWTEAENKLVQADQVIVIGYSFPTTDVRSSALFRSAFIRRTTMPEVVIVNPEPTSIAERFKYDFGITDNKLHIIKGFFTNDFDLENLS